MRSAALAILTLILGACSEGTSAPSTTVADSSGIRIVTNPERSVEAAPRWSLHPEPTFEIGSQSSGETTFFRITAVVPLFDDGVVVGTSSPAEARVFGADGSPLATLGREGEGPGEFWTVTSVVPFSADSIAVWDQNRQRLSVFSPEGQLLRERSLGHLVPPSPEAVGNALDPAAFSYLLPSGPGSFFVFSVGGFGPGSGVRRVAAPSFRIGAAGSPLSRFGPFPGMQSYLSEETGVAPYPFGMSTHGASLGDTLVIGTAEQPELRYYGPDGNLLRIVRWPDEERPVGGARLALWDEWINAQLEDMPPPERASIREILDNIPRAEQFPAYEGLIAADSGELWVGAYPGQLGIVGLPGAPPRMPSRRWLVFHREGALAASIETPVGFEPHAVRTDRVWGVFTDEFDVESVRAYRIERSDPDTQSTRP